jgi:branched-chain amino acid aminotransferase
MNIDVEIRKISVSEVIAAAQSGSLKEMFGAGTAAVISPIAGFGYQETEYDLPTLKTPFAETLKKAITDIQTNKVKDPYGWRVMI